MGCTVSIKRRDYGVENRAGEHGREKDDIRVTIRVGY